MTTALFAFFSYALACFLGAVGALFLKKGATLLSFSYPYNRYLFYGILCDGAGIVLGTLMLRFGDLSTLYALNGTTYLWITVFSKHYLQEKMTSVKAMGILCIIIGTAIIGITS